MALTGEVMMEFCRLCQSHLGKTPLHYEDDLINKIVEVTRVQVNDELSSYLPMLVCVSCQEKVLDMYNYIQIVQKVDEDLRSAVKNKYFTDTDNTVTNSNQTTVYEDIYKCDKCASSFADLNLLEEHNKSHIEEGSKYECSVCLRTYNKERNYIIHKKVHLELYCIKCSKIFDLESERETHACANSSELISDETDSIINHKTKLHKAKISKPKFKIKSEDLKFRTFPQEGDCFQCNMCDKKLKSRRYLLRHLKIHQNFACSQKNCLKAFPSAYSLKIHQLDHLEKRPYLCVTCGKSFRTKSSLSCHEKIHSEVKEYKCDLCNIGFYVRSNLRAHEKKYHEGIRFYCTKCTKEFLSKSSLERHEKTHIGIKEFKCAHCTSAFYTNKELMKHQRYHQDLRQHKCGECFKTFFERHHLTIHLRTHSGERPYVCKIPGCGKAFAESQKLKRHHSAKHNAVS